jgi:hypothetical protein
MKLELSLSVCIIYPYLLCKTVSHIIQGDSWDRDITVDAIKKVSGNMAPTLNGYGAMGVFLIFVNAFLWTVCTSDKVYYMLRDFKQVLILTLYGIWCKQISGSSLWDPHASSTGSHLLLQQAMCTIHNYEKRYTVNIRNPSLSRVRCKLKAISWL